MNSVLCDCFRVRAMSTRGEATWMGAEASVHSEPEENNGDVEDTNLGTFTITNSETSPNTVSAQTHSGRPFF